MLTVCKSRIDGVLTITPPTVHEDFRGSYVELYNEKLYRDAIGDIRFVQDDMSMSSRHVLRGIHGDRHTHKLITCLLGRLYVVIVDCRDASPQQGQWESFIVTGENHRQVLVPPGCGVAHLVLSEQAIFHYKQSTYYDRANQFTKMWNDPALNIWWPIRQPLLSQRDAGFD